MDCVCDGKLGGVPPPPGRRPAGSGGPRQFQLNRRVTRSFPALVLNESSSRDGRACCERLCMPAADARPRPPALLQERRDARRTRT